MNLHSGARTCPASLVDRSSRPRRSPGRTPVEWREMILLQGRTKMTGAQIARDLKRPRATVARVLKRAGLERLKRLEVTEPENRYRHRRPGDLLHLDVKKLGRISGYYGHRITGCRQKQRRSAGWDYVHVAIDDCTRMAYAEVLRDESAETSAMFLRRAGLVPHARHPRAPDPQGQRIWLPRAALRP